MIKRLLRWLGWPPCEHDWRAHSAIEHFVKANGERIVTGHTYVKECSKCHRLWAQRVP